MKRLLPEFAPTAEQLNNIRRLASECNLLEETVKILYGRGVDTREKISDFLHPSRAHFISPLKMSGMAEAVQLITRARDGQWAVVVYGDYDADGVCAATIMCGVLREFGIEYVVPFVPERKDGYGLSIAALDGIFEEHFPQLFITVDCGISCREEIEYIKEQGAEVIVTDHHELPEKLPDCVCVNPKFNDGYMYDNLCGAGVAFKVGCALIGDEAMKFLDFAAIATVADSVPLTGENRDIVYEGLKLINFKPRECYKYFFSKQDGDVTSQSLAFSVAPKINAAGRMGDAASALKLFLSSDAGEIFDLSSKLTEYNVERQKYCDELYLSAKRKIAEKPSDGRVIMLYDEGWNAGFVGIVAARIADEYSRPAILFVKNGDMLKGSARSVENVNIYEALRACSKYISEFGGHAQAAGVNVSCENFPLLERALSDFVAKKYSAEDFSPTASVSGEFRPATAVRLARELEMLEPYGVGNKRPLFYMDGGALSAKPIKPLSPHLSIKGVNLEMLFFGGAKYRNLLECGAKKCLVFEFNVSRFKGKEYIKGFVRDVIYDGTAGEYAGEYIAANAVLTLGAPDVGVHAVPVSREEVQKALDGATEYGTVFIAGDYKTLSAYNTGKLHVELFNPSSKNPVSCILVAPRADAELSGYENVIYMDGSAVKVASLAGKTVRVCADINAYSELSEISASREDLLKIFAQMSADCKNIEGSSCEEAAFHNRFANRLQWLFALCVFEQLGLISFSDGKLSVVRGKRTELSNSPLYREVVRLKEGTL